MIAEYQRLMRLLKTHKPQEITLPNGEWGENCVECDGYEYPCDMVPGFASVEDWWPND